MNSESGIEPLSTSNHDPFSAVYDRGNRGYGEKPSAVLGAFLERGQHRGMAYDLGAGAGRDTFAILAAGYDVVCCDRSQRGLSRVHERAIELGVEDRLELVQADVRDAEFPEQGLDLIVATTILDHLPATDAVKLWQRMCTALTPGGYLYAEVHTTDDPGCGEASDVYRRAPVSETASAVINYFANNQLAEWTLNSKVPLRLRHYEGRLEWDTTHGAPHLHGKAILLAERIGRTRAWYGQVPLELPPDSIREMIE